MENNVFISKCEDYNVDNINKSFKEILLDSSLLDFVKEGITKFDVNELVTKINDNYEEIGIILS